MTVPKPLRRSHYQCKHSMEKINGSKSDHVLQSCSHRNVECYERLIVERIAADATSMGKHDARLCDQLVHAAPLRPALHTRSAESIFHCASVLE